MKTNDTFIPSVYPLLAKAYMTLKNRSFSEHSNFFAPYDLLYHWQHYEGLTLKIEVDFNRFSFAYRPHSFLPYKEIYQVFHKRDIGGEKKLTKENFLNCLKDFGLNLEILSYLIGDN